MPRLSLISLFCFLCGAHCTRLLYNLYTQPTYEVGWVKELPSEYDGTLGETIVGNRPVSCIIPSVAEYTAPIPPDEATIAAAKESLAQSRPSLAFVNQFVYWAYKIDHGELVTQFAPQSFSENELVFDSSDAHYILGRGDPQETFANASLIYRHGMYMLNVSLGSGDECDITGAPRRTDLLYYCDPNFDSEPKGSWVFETFVCEYEAEIGDSALCEFPGFSSSSTEVQYILCSYKDTGRDEVDEQAVENPDSLDDAQAAHEGQAADPDEAQTAPEGCEADHDESHAESIDGQVTSDDAESRTDAAEDVVGGEDRIIERKESALDHMQDVPDVSEERDMESGSELLREETPSLPEEMVIELVEEDSHEEL